MNSKPDLIRSRFLAQVVVVVHNSGKILTKKHIKQDNFQNGGKHIYTAIMFRSS